MSEMVDNEAASEVVNAPKTGKVDEKDRPSVAIEDEFQLPDWVPEWAREAPKLVVRAPGPKSKAIIKIDREYVSYAYDRCFTFTFEKAAGASVMDADGNILLDFTSGIGVENAGWTHPKVVKAIQDQASRLIHSMANDAYFDKEA
ncbi:TPA: aminotransferase class III-fold pyridoxal phosphate-dependent enzyme, partial [Thermoplasmata archaeon]|nr:aminotransferase class III-fold pyridoxal phosphate-dependent enzyme [Thermoplasmata archaeon]